MVLRANRFNIENRDFRSILAVGSYRTNMRELADDLMLSMNTRVYVDSRESAAKEAGEIIQSKVDIDSMDY